MAEEIPRRIHEVKLARVLVHDFGDDGVFPELVDGFCDFRGKVGVGVAERCDVEVEDFVCQGLYLCQCQSKEKEKGWKEEE